MMKNIFFYCLAILMFPLISSADEINLKNGAILRGRVVSVDSEKIVIESEGAGTLTLDRKEVRRLVYDDGSSVDLDGALYDSAAQAGEEESAVDKAGGPEVSGVTYSISAGAGTLSGHTTYQIGGQVDSPEESYTIHFPLSELEFPLNVYMVTVKCEARFLEKMKAGISFSKNINSDAGLMKDSDWGIPFIHPVSGETVWYGPDHKDIYSESDAKLEALIADIDLSYRIMKKSNEKKRLDFSLFAGLGYSYHRFNFECTLIQQWDLRPDVPDDDSQNLDVEGDGRMGLTYDVRYDIPYLNLTAEIIFNKKFHLNMEYGFAPIVFSRDRDNHILRDKISRAVCREGVAHLFSASAGYFINESFFIKLSYDFSIIESTGREKQWDNGEYSATIDHKNFSKQNKLDLSAGVEF